MKTTKGTILRWARIRADKTTTEVAEALGVSAQTIRNWEADANPIPLDKAVEFCKIVAIDIKELTGE
jgi:DNA-binding XRE family transcriptional regulator